MLAHRGGGESAGDHSSVAALEKDEAGVAAGAGAGATSREARTAQTGIVLDSAQLDRVRIRLDGLATYVMVSALLVGGILGVFFNTPKAFAAGRVLENAVTAVFLATSAASLVSSVYVTLAFSLVSLYSKTALGLGKDGQYAEFLDATRKERNYAYDAFLLSLVSFQASFVMSLFLAVQGPARWAVAGAAALLMALSCRSVLSILKAATRLVFSDD
jgi:hypothetical protein